ncbi:MDIS1-interacting receptor like kinase 2, partial [Mucuna pruriens]
MLNLSYNHLNVKIPTRTQLQTFYVSNFVGNILCSSNGKIHSNDQIGKGSDRHGVIGQLLSMALLFKFNMGEVFGLVHIYRLDHVRFLHCLRLRFKLKKWRTLTWTWKSVLRFKFNTSYGYYEDYEAYIRSIFAANGTIPSQIGNLSNLVYLDLSNSLEPLFAENLDWLSSLSKLEYLHLGYANLSNSFDWLHTLQALPSLTDLHLSQCTLPRYSQPSLLNFSSLLTLDLSFTSYSSAISSIPRWIFGLRKLVSLQFSYNNIQGPIPDGIQNLTLLQNLDLTFNSLSSSIPEWLYGLHHLKSLSIEFNKLNGTISDALGNLTSLVELHLSNNQLEGTIPTSLVNLTSLVELDLSNNQLSENPFESLRSLSKLSYLEIEGNHFEGIIKEDHLANLTSLEVFYASGNNFTLKVGPNWLPTFQLTDLDMSSWQLGPNFPSWIQSQNKIGYLHMPNTGISNSIPTWFWETFSQAFYINLTHNHIHGELATTKRIPISINTVDLSRNHLC